MGYMLIRESARTFGERFKDHLRLPSPSLEHQLNTGHNITLEDFAIVCREG